jgi:hypothetical protein
MSDKVLFLRDNKTGKLLVVEGKKRLAHNQPLLML